MPDQEHDTATTPATTGMHGSAAQINRLLKKLSWTTPLTIIVLTCAIGACFYWLQARPLATAGAKARQQAASEQVIAKVESLVGQIERVLLTARDMSNDGLFGVDDPQTFNRMMIPVLKQRDIVSSIYLARDDGKMMYLMRDKSGWKNRITDVAGKGKQQRWLHWSDPHTLLGEEWKEQDYDPRKRPWYQGVMATPEGKVHWTTPYIFTVSPEPGITAAVRFTGQNSGQTYVLAMDVLLTDISRFTTQLKYGEKGQVALLTSDDKVLGLPRNAGFSTDDALKKAILQEPGTIGLKALAAALQQAQTGSTDIQIPAGASGEQENWIARLQEVPFGNQRFKVAMLSPASQFSPWSGSLIVILLLLLGAVLTLCVVMIRKIFNDVTHPVNLLFDQLETTNRQLEIQMSRAKTVAEMAPKLQASTSFADLSHAFMAGLSGRISLGQGSLYLVDQDRQRLYLCGGYALPDTAAIPAELAFGEGMLGQCALERKALLLNHPTTGYLKLSSTLIVAEPAAILLLPVLNNETLLGVLELAVFDELTQEERDIVDELLPMLALCMEVIGRSEDMQKPFTGTTAVNAELEEAP